MGVNTSAAGIDAMPVSQSVACGPSASDQPILRGVINGATADTTPVAATAGKIQRILSLELVVTTTAVAITFEDLTSTTHTALTGAMTPLAGTPLVLPWNPHGWFESKSGGAFNIHQSGTSQISGCYTYQLVDPTDV